MAMTSITTITFSNMTFSNTNGTKNVACEEVYNI
jgi:hypothetical protein